MIKRYKPTKDNTISNAFDSSLITRAVSASMGQSHILENFSIYGQVSSSDGLSTEEARILIEFDLTEIQGDITNKVVPAGSSYYLRLYNAAHAGTNPVEFNLEAHSISGSWQEGYGLDMDDYRDLSYGVGSNWSVRSGSTAWSTAGGDVYANTSSAQTFNTGLEDMDLDVTTQVQAWLDSVRPNDGFMIKLPTALTDGSEQRSFYTKKFFARGSEFFYKRPVLEVRWNSATQDDRINFYTSSSLSPAVDNLNTLYLYNYQRGALTNIPAIGTGSIYVDLYSEAGGTKLNQCINTPATGGYVETGVYTASVCLETTASTIADVWFSGSVQYHTGSITTKAASALSFPPENNLVVSCVGSQENYYSKSTNRFYFYIREKKWSPNIFTTATSSPTTEVYENLYYKITRLVGDETIFDYDTTTNSTLLSYDSKGNFFDLDLSMLEPDYTYLIELALHSVATKTFEQLSFKHKFRVVNNEY